MSPDVALVEDLSHGPGAMSGGDCRCAFCTFKLRKREGREREYTAALSMHSVRTIAHERLIAILEGPCVKAR